MCNRSSQYGVYYKSQTQFPLSLILVVIGHDWVCERVARQVHIVLVRRFVIVLYSLSVFGKHYWRLIVFNDAVILDQATGVNVRLIDFHIIGTLVLLDTRKFTCKHRPITSARPCFTRHFGRHNLFLSEDLLWGLIGCQRVFLAGSLTWQAHHLCHLLGRIVYRTLSSWLRIRGHHACVGISVTYISQLIVEALFDVIGCGHLSLTFNNEAIVELANNAAIVRRSLLLA